MQQLGNKGYVISTDQNKLDISVIHGFISQSYWAKGVPITVLAKAIEHSLCFGVFTDQGEQVGFARLITDRATFAYLADVFITDQHRGNGLSKLLIEKVISHPDIQGLRRMMLATRDAHGLYAQYGFLPVDNPEILMQIWRPNIYQQAQNDT
ncbi:GNAT family N-acetyltransferase [Shewanella sp. 10N.286.51.B2]|uniref:GNAT family N-acetyltransferase n=1 Tax=unclassified Shewanella TaxID=196818 RepID=UPI0026E36EFC|nr:MULTISPECIES: GNAT family N-acetyltransferase [unclassified Shewanella]MDO6620912.1 GNAT family N-acetyltransferase [Shewanella sp. 6_MG-2023]MDO6641844.1 GNAT family N-acetyltransferase [Shewanella sp. 5_MG-2023]